MSHPRVQVRRVYDQRTDGAQAAALAHLRQLAAVGTLTLVTATKEVSISEAAILAELIQA